MMRRGLAVFLLGLLPLQVAAQTISVRSGEHDGFSRLVMPIPVGTKWSLIDDPNGKALRLDLESHLFDTSEVFDRIPRTRLAGLSQAGKGKDLRLFLGCACRVDVFVHSESWLVLDIRDPGPEQAALPVVLPSAPVVPFRFALSNRSEPAWPPFPIGEPVAQPTDRAVAAPAAREPDTSSRLEKELNRQISKAAGQGLLTIKPGVAHPVGEADQARRQMQSAGHGMQVAGPDESAATPGSGVSVSAVSSIDQASGAGQAPPVKPPICFDQQDVDVAAWATGQTFAQQVAAWRGDLAEEFDRMDAEAAIGLARTYLHFGFGAEARQVLAIAAVPEHIRDILNGLARVLDDETLAPDNPFLGQEVCESAVSLWATLSAPVKPADSNAVLRAFSALPEHLRQLLAPRLSARFAEVGNLGAADQVLRIARRGPPVHAPEIDLSDARLDMARGDMDDALGALSHLAQKDTPATPQAVIALVDAHWRKKSAPAPDTPDIIAAFETEYSKTALGPGLRRAHAMSLALLNRFPEAFQAAGALTEADGAALHDELAAALLGILVERGDDLTFLRFGSDYSMSPPEWLPAATGTAMARRFLDLGFDKPAASLLARFEADDPGDAEFQLLRARSALANGQPHRALVELLTQDGPEAARLRGEALLRIGDYVGAAGLLDEAGESEASARAMWLAGQWDAFSTAEQTALARSARLALAASQDEPGKRNQGELALSRSLLADSTFLRRELSDLFPELADPSLGRDGS